MTNEEAIKAVIKAHPQVVKDVREGKHGLRTLAEEAKKLGASHSVGWLAAVLATAIFKPSGEGWTTSE